MRSDGRWVSVSERLPPRGMLVLLWLPGWAELGGCSYSIDLIMPHGAWGIHSPKDVSHWWDGDLPAGPA